MKGREMKRRDRRVISVARAIGNDSKIRKLAVDNIYPRTTSRIIVIHIIFKIH